MPKSRNFSSSSSKIAETSSSQNSIPPSLTYSKPLETELSSKSKAEFTTQNIQASLNFPARAFHGVNPTDTKIGNEAPNLIIKWVGVQLAPILTVGLPTPVEELLLHSFRLPSFLIKSDYQKLYDFFYEALGSILDEAKKMGIKCEEACPNLIFAAVSQSMNSPQS